jgi:Mn2+/Fe2+ NRAMP family transporter
MLPALQKRFPTRLSFLTLFLNHAKCLISKMEERMRFTQVILTFAVPAAVAMLPLCNSAFMAELSNPQRATARA